MCIRDRCGSLPTASEVRRFLQNPDPDKRNALIDQLLSHNRYADYFSLIWADILHNRRQRVEHYRYGTYRFHAWLRQQFLHNRRYDDLVRDILGAQGDIQTHPPVVFHRLIRNTDQYVEHTSQLFLGVQMSCAQCHHHPFEKWGQDDFYGMAGFFNGLKHTSQRPAPELVYHGGYQPRRIPLVNQLVLPRPPGGRGIENCGESDPRVRLAEWVTRPDNPYFARLVANRIWKQFLGRGLVEPEDDFRSTNPPTNPALLDHLAEQLVADRFDLKKLMRHILSSRVYQLSSIPNQTNAADEQSYSHHLVCLLYTSPSQRDGLLSRMPSSA